MEDTEFHVSGVLCIRRSALLIANNCTQSHRDMLISKLASSEDIKFYWCIAAAEFDVQDAECYSELLKSITELFVDLLMQMLGSKSISRHNTNVLSDPSLRKTL